MGIVRFKIELDNRAKTYQSGSVLSGNVYLDLDSPKSVKGLEITVFGSGQIFFKWGKQNVFVKEEYLNEDYHPLGVDGQVVIPEGRHVYPFSFNLPETIPNTYKDQVGRIEYELKATIQRPWYLCNHKESTSFAVVVPLDLNSHHCNAAEPVVEEISQTFMGCSDPVYMTVSLPVRGYVPGQTMPVMVDIKNEAEVDLKEVRLELVKVNLYHGTYARTHKAEVVLAEHETPVPETGDIETRIQHLLQIPHVQPSFLINSSIIDIEYIVRVKVKVGGLHMNFKLDVPVIIGTTALLDSTVSMFQPYYQTG